MQRWWLPPPMPELTGQGLQSRVTPHDPPRVVPNKYNKNITTSSRRTASLYHRRTSETTNRSTGLEYYLPSNRDSTPSPIRFVISEILRCRAIFRRRSLKPNYPAFCVSDSRNTPGPTQIPSPCMAQVGHVRHEQVDA